MPSLPQPFDHDVLISGAGPAGIATSVALVRADPSLRGRILVVDRARFPRAKPCGGGLTGHADEALAALGLELAVPSFPSPRATVRFGALARDVALPRPVKVVRREDFDASLVAQARDHGVEVREEADLAGSTVEHDGVTASVGGSRVRARVLVGADGVSSTVRKHLVGHRGDDARGPRPIRLFRAELPSRGRVSDTMLYDFTPMRDGLRGYLWIFPVPGDRVNVGLMHAPTVNLTGAALTKLLAARLAEHGVALDGATRGWPAWGWRGGGRVAAAHAWGAWGWCGGGRVAAAHLVTVGDAAGIDALTGEGIAVGLEHGLVAAQQIVAALATGDFRFAGYARALRRATVGRELSLDGWLAWLLYDGDAWRRWLSLVLLDDKLLELYAARVSGTLVLADHKRELVKALARHAFAARARRRRLDEALAT